LQDSLCYHIDRHGVPLYDIHSHNRPRFFELDVFHKGFARAKDERGWFFVDRRGNELVPSTRFRVAEPFYNGQALVTCSNGERAVVTEQGEIKVKIRSPHEEDVALLQEVRVIE